VADLHVGSEVGRLRRVIVHRPDRSLRRLTPTNRHELLFDEVLKHFPEIVDEKVRGR